MSCVGGSACSWDGIHNVEMEEFCRRRQGGILGQSDYNVAGYIFKDTIDHQKKQVDSKAIALPVIDEDTDT
jgi:hypothetical protein